MFKDLLVLEKQRTWKEAFGFYLAYVVLWFGVVVIWIMVYLLVWVPLTGTPTGSPEATERLQGLVGYRSTLNPMWCGLLVSLVLEKKGHSRTLKYVLIGVLSLGLAGGWGILLGMVPTAYLTTIKPEGPPAP
tara:strand:- start:987 stop:1382 length:396 start_codon:yes stop_codon:yes gene_type:complete